MFGLFNIGRTKLIIREISNFFFLQKTIEGNVNSEEWKNFKLRTDITNRIYTVVSLREEDMGDMADVKKFRVLEKIRPINEYLTTLGLQEIILPGVEEIKGTLSYLVVYTPYFSELTIKWIVANIALPLAAIFTIWFSL